MQFKGPAIATGVLQELPAGSSQGAMRRTIEIEGVYEPVM